MNILKRLCILSFILFIPGGTASSQASPVSYNVSVSGTVRDTIVTFVGWTAPSSLLTFTDGGSVVGTSSANSAGYFQKSLYAQLPGNHGYGLMAEDLFGRTTPTYTYTLSLQARMETTISNIVLPPTIDITKDTFEQGEPIDLYGMAVPNSALHVFVNSVSTLVYDLNSKPDGTWNITVNDVLDIGQHESYSKVTKNTGQQSSRSNTLDFEITPRATYCYLADINNDGAVNLTDFSIMMFYWGTNNVRSDLSCDGTVNLTDFSILMFYWTG